MKRALLCSAALWLQLCASALGADAEDRGTKPMLAESIDRPLRYTPDGTDFVIEAKGEFFNRPLYGGNSAFRVDGGDEPEFSLYLPGRGGNLRLGIEVDGKRKWLHEAQRIIARYRPGEMVYEIHDPLLGDGALKLTAIATRKREGLLVRAELAGSNKQAELLLAFGGVSGIKGTRDGDIGCEKKPVTEFFQLRPEQCEGDKASVSGNTFGVHGKPGQISGVVSDDAALAVADAAGWDSADKLWASNDEKTTRPVVRGAMKLTQGKPVFVSLAVNAKDGGATTATELTKTYDEEESLRQAVADRVVVMTPDPFINAAASALNIAADGVWDDRQNSFMHGAVAWRMRLLGWRGPYAGDELGWHDRTALHFAGYAEKQNESPIPDTIAAADASANLSRHEDALHSTGDLTKTHYDMNLAGVDVFFRHLLWTGDLDYAKKMWPVIQRHLAWERRLFRREYGPEKLPLYEGYCCIWASDDLEYNGGGGTHSSAYNLFHNRMAARVAKLIGEDPTPYEKEADLIEKGMNANLWLADRGWFAEWKDLLGLQLTHDDPAVWTFYHTIDSQAATPMQAWQMSRFVDTHIPHIPVKGEGVPSPAFTVSTTDWMPYTWSLNNVVMAETMHTALAYWQMGRGDVANTLFRGGILDSMYLGACPGNVGMCTYYDVARRESQRDFADGVGMTSRALVEGLFGIEPDLLAGEVRLHPGFPTEWNEASIKHPDFEVDFHREGLDDTYTVHGKFAHPVKYRLRVPALREDVASVTVNGQNATYKVIDDSVGRPQIEVETPAAEDAKITIQWKGKAIAIAPSMDPAQQGMDLTIDCGTKVLELADPQGVLHDEKLEQGRVIRGKVAGKPGERTLFAKVEQGAMRWWQPITLSVPEVSPMTSAMDWSKHVTAQMDCVDLSKLFNDKVTSIFRNEYLSPRSPFCSLAVPKQGIGSWCHPQQTFDVEDSGLRKAAGSAGKITLPNGIPLSTPGASDARNIAFVSQWDNYPREISIPVTGKSSKAYLLMAGSTWALQSHFDNGELIAEYEDGSSSRLALRNPDNWWPIDQDYFVDDYGFKRTGPLPVRVDLKSGQIRTLQLDQLRGKNLTVSGGAATVVEFPLESGKTLKTMKVRCLANEIVIGVMSVTLER